MPSVYVVPGGGLSAVDRESSGFPEPVDRPLGNLDVATCRDLLPFARAALRESFEETGALLGNPISSASEPADDASRSEEAEKALAPHWQAYRKSSLRPAFERLRLVARAITPAGSPIRFHTRFFMADGSGLCWAGTGDGELEDIGWCPVEQALDRPLPEITRLVIGEALRAWRDPVQPHMAPLFYCRGDRLLRRVDAPRHA